MSTKTGDHHNAGAEEMSAAEAIEALASAVTAGAAVAAAVFAYLALKTWRKEMLGRRKAELAEEVLAGFYEIREMLQSARSPLTRASAEEGRKRKEGENEEVARELSALHALIARLDAERAFLSAFYAKEHRFRAVFGHEATKPFSEAKAVLEAVVGLVNTLAADLRSLASGLETRLGSDQAHDEQLEYVTRVWSPNPKEDEFGKWIDYAVNQIEETCRPAIEAREAQRK